MAIHKISWSPDWCTCQVTYAYDDSLPQDQMIFTGDSIDAKCPDHRAITDPVELYNILHTETLTKERTRAAIVDAVPQRLVDVDPDTRARSQSENLGIEFIFTGTARNRTVTAGFKIRTTRETALTDTERNALRTPISQTLINDPLVDQTKVTIFDSTDNDLSQLRTLPAGNQTRTRLQIV